MSWVLILVSPEMARPPTAIGGYPTREEAEAAGEAATAASEDRDVPMPQFYRYVVVPGAACSGPSGATHGGFERNYLFEVGKYEVKRHVYRWPESE